MATQQYDVFQPEVWSAKITRFFGDKLLAGSFFLNYSDDVSMGGDTINIPNIADSFTATDVNVTSGDITATNLADTTTALSIDKWKAAAFVISDFQAAQIAKKYKLQSEYVSAASYKLAKALDTALLTNAGSLTASVGSSSTALVSSNLEAAIAVMESNSIPLQDCVWFFHPKAYWKEISAIQKYYDASNFGKATTPYGNVDTLYGMPVLVTANVQAVAGSGHTNLLAYKGAVAYAMANLWGSGKKVRIQVKSAESLRKKIIADIAYGTVLLNATRGVRVISNA